MHLTKSIFIFNLKKEFMLHFIVKQKQLQQP